MVTVIRRRSVSRAVNRPRWRSVVSRRRVTVFRDSPASPPAAGTDAAAAGGIAGTSDRRTRRPAPPRRRRLRRPKLGIQSKLLFMLLVTSIMSCVVVGVVGYRSGRGALREKAFEQLTFVRNSRAHGHRAAGVQPPARQPWRCFTRGRTAVQAVDALDEGFHELADSTLTGEQEADLHALLRRGRSSPDSTPTSARQSVPDVFVPTSPAQRYLQAFYTAPFEDFDDALRSTTPETAVPGRPPTPSTTTSSGRSPTRFDYEDLLLLDTEGNVVYSAYKGVDLGTNCPTAVRESTAWRPCSRRPSRPTRPTSHGHRLRPVSAATSIRPGGRPRRSPTATTSSA